MFRYPITILTGVPGVGKTTVTNFLKKKGIKAITYSKLKNPKKQLKKLLLTSLTQRIVIDSHLGTEDEHVRLIKATTKDIFVLSPIITVLLTVNYKEYKSRVINDTKTRKILTETEFFSYLSTLIAYHVQISTWFYLIQNTSSEKTADLIERIIKSHGKILDPFFPLRMIT